MPKLVTGQCPFLKWTPSNVQLPKMFAFGQMEHMPKLHVGTKLKSRAFAIRYMGLMDLRRVTVQLYDGTLKQYRVGQFHPVHPASDPTAKHNIAFRSFTEKVEPNSD